MNNSIPKYAVVITFSFDPSVSVLLFDTDMEAMEFIKKDILEEWKIDTQENGWDSEYEIFETEGRAVLTTYWENAADVTEWKIGTVYDPNDVTTIMDQDEELYK